MKKLILLTIVLSLGLSVYADDVFKNLFKKEKPSNHSIGLSLMGKTFKCDGVSMSYLVAEQGTMTFACGLDFNYEKMIKKTPLGLLTGLRAEYCRPYHSYVDDWGNQVKLVGFDVVVGVPVMIQYHDKIGDQTELQLFAGPCLDFILIRGTGVSSVQDIYLFGGLSGPIVEPIWRGLDVSFQYGIGIRHKNITFRLSNGLGLMNHFKKDYTAQNLGYPVYIQRPIMGTVLFNW